MKRTKNKGQKRSFFAPFFAHFFSQNHNILWSNSVISSCYHNTSSESLSPHEPYLEYLKFLSSCFYVHPLNIVKSTFFQQFIFYCSLYPCVVLPCWWQIGGIATYFNRAIIFLFHFYTAFKKENPLIQKSFLIVLLMFFIALFCLVCYNLSV